MITRDEDSLLSLQRSAIVKPLGSGVQWFMEPMEPFFARVVSEEDNGGFLLDISNTETDDAFKSVLVSSKRATTKTSSTGACS